MLQVLTDSHMGTVNPERTQPCYGVTKVMSMNEAPFGGIDFSDFNFTWRDGSVTNGSEIPKSAWIVGLVRTLKHVDKSEIASWVTNAQDAATEKHETFDDTARAAVIGKAVEHYIDLITTPDKWKIGRSDSNAKVGETPLAKFIRVAGEKATQEKLDKDGTPKGPNGGYVQDGEEYALSVWTEHFLASEDLVPGDAEGRTQGQIRTAEAVAKGTADFEKWKADRDLKAAKKAREAAAPKLTLRFKSDEAAA